LKGTHPGTIPARFDLIWLSGFRGEDLNVMLAPFQNCIRRSRLPTKMAAKLKIEKRGNESLIVHCCFSVSLKSSSLCLYSSNLGTFWLKIEQFWPFEEISIFRNSGHLEWRAGLSDTILKLDTLVMIQTKFGFHWSSTFRGEDF
jgi:hypothetical protein